MTLVISRDLVDGLGFDFEAAVADYVARLQSHRLTTAGEPAPSAHPLVERAVVRRPSSPVSSDDARAQIMRGVCASLSETYHHQAARARADLNVARRSMTTVQRVAAKVLGDPLAAQERAVEHVEATARGLAAGVLPLAYAHLVPDNPPIVASGPDEYVADYRIE